MILRYFCLAGLSLLALLLPSGTRAQGGLVHNGDFEMAAPENPPAGWMMWGSQQYKVPANYTRDTTNPHGGQACFRIYHPKGSAGYVVSSPEFALHPKRAMQYTVSFWARTDKPGPSLFGFTCYSSLNPYTDAPSPGFNAINVGPEWKEFHFTIHEGWDLFADRSPILLLTFNATRNAEEEKTLWLDDVSVTEQPSTRQGRLVEEGSLVYERLAHRLRPGDQLDLTVDAGKRLRRATRDVGGVSFHRVCGWTGQPYNRQGEYTLRPDLEAAIREMRLPMTRFYGVGDEPFGVEASIDRVADVCRRTGVPEEHVVLEFETQGATSTLAPEVWARGVRYSLSKGYKFRFWEISNEPYITGSATAFPTPEAYIEHFKAVSAAIRAAHPEGQIGVAINAGSQKWGNYILKETAGGYDFVVGHHYAVRDIHRRKFEVASLTENYKKLDEVLRLNALIRAYNPGREVYQYDTEWGMHSGGPNGERADYVNRNANIYGTMHRAVRLIYYAREGMLRGASSWQMFSSVSGPGFGILSQQAPEKRFILYWLYYYFNRHVGDWVVDAEGTSPYYTPAQGDDPFTRPGEFAGPLTPALATVSADGRSLYLVVANGSWDRSVPCRIALKRFRPGQAKGTILSQADPDAKALLERKEDAVSDLPVQTSGQELTFALPAHSVAFVTVPAR